MTQEEVDLIYEYLHENYEYRDGELIRKTKAKYGSKIGDSLGCFVFHGKFTAIRTSLTINDKQFISTLSKLIWIYHKKKYSEKIIFLDDNPLNSKIENLKSISNSKYNSLKHKDSNGFVKIRNKFYSVIKIHGKNVGLGTYENKNIASEVTKYARDLYLEKGLSEYEIKSLIKKKYKSNFRHEYEYKYGFPGIFKRSDKFVGCFTINKKRIRTAGFNTPEEAHAAYLKAKEEYAKTKTIPDPSSN